MFTKLVAIEPVNLTPEARERLSEYAGEVVLYDSLPANDAEIVERIGDADAMLVSYTTRVDQAVLEAVPNLRYIGMCCSLYSEESANVDIAVAREHGITVTGVRDYGDTGVVEFAISELARYLHGFGEDAWREGEQYEIGSLSCGVIGLGTTGSMIAEALRFFGAKVCYYSRTRKPAKEQKGLRYLPLMDLLAESDAVFTCLNKGAVLLGDPEFEALGTGKMLFNTSIGPGHDPAALARWLEAGDRAAELGGAPNAFFCDTESALCDSDQVEVLLTNPHVHCMRKSAGSTAEAKVRLGQKVLANIATYLARG
ncbi:MAG: NAD(P)-dependent oxidoreductase [Eggerthellaceae bacterium]|jgi:phosphoglycerate dehydrogenase-like enzyme